MTVCECCGRALDDPLGELRRWCLDRGHWVSPLDEVRTAAAAAILGCSEQWLRTQRCYFDAIPARRAGKHMLYKLEDLLRRIDA